MRSGRSNHNAIASIFRSTTRDLSAYKVVALWLESPLRIRWTGIHSPMSSLTKRLSKMVSTASWLGARYLRDVVENKPASSLVVCLSKALNGTPPSLCGRQMGQFFSEVRVGDKKGIPPQNKCHVQYYKIQIRNYLLWRPLVGKKAERQQQHAHQTTSITIF